MPLKTSALNAQRNTFTWKYLDEEIVVTYNPQAFTPAVEAKINDSMAGGAQSQSLVYLLRMFLVDWDLVEDAPAEDGTVSERPFGVSEEKMMTLPTVFIGDAIKAITDDIQSLRAEGKPSTGGSPQTV